MRPAPVAASAASIASESIISTAAGMIAASTMSPTVSPAASIDGKSASTVRTACGVCSSRTVTLVQTPSVPSEPMNSPRRSGPACSPVGPPSVTTRAVGEHDLHLQHVVGGEAVLQAVRAAGVLRDVAADGADLLAGRVGRVVEPVRGGGLGDLEVVDAGLEHRAPVLDVDLEDAAQLLHRDHDAVGDGHRAAREAGARAARHERHPVLRAEPDRARDLLGVAGEHDERRHLPEPGEAVALVAAQTHLIGDHAVLRQQIGELPDHLGFDHQPPPRLAA